MEILWGYFGKTNMQFSCANIADRISDLDPFSLFELTEMVEHPIELVRVIKSAEIWFVLRLLDWTGGMMNQSLMDSINFHLGNCTTWSIGHSY